MPQNVDHLLEERARRGTAERASIVTSLIFHGVVVAAAWIVPELLAKPPEVVEAFSVIVVPPQALGAEAPPPPPPPPPKAEPPPPEPPPPEAPPPEKIPEDVPVLADKQKKVERKPPPPKRPPPRRSQPEPEPPPKRVGSPFGSSLGASTQQATLGVEDPNFTYGYYLNQVVAVISSNWVRPPMGNLETRLHFRIQRDGTITELRVVAPSTSRQFDDAAVRAVNTSSPLPPLPKGYAEDHLGINLIVK